MSDSVHSTQRCGQVVQPPAPTPSVVVEAALRRAFHLGQLYWQQADSDFTSQHRKADETKAKFNTLKAETIAALGGLHAQALGQINPSF